MTGTRAKELTLIMWEKIKKLYRDDEYQENVEVSKEKVLTDMLADKTVKQNEIKHMLWDCFLCTYFKDIGNGYIDCKQCPLKSCASDDSIYASVVLPFYTSPRKKIIKNIDKLIRAVTDWTPID
jgi:hypothetical protein